MRHDGYAMTPDSRLELPVEVNGHILTWIESKASFGDPKTIRDSYKGQFLPYKTRFGAGLVIYWFGFVEDFEDADGQPFFQVTSLTLARYETSRALGR